MFLRAATSTALSYTGQFGFFFIEPRRDPGNYDAEFFLALKEWDPYWTTQLANSDSLDVGYQRFSINDRSLGFADPLRVKEGDRIMLRILNASATQLRRIAFAGHRFRVLALDGNPVASPQEVDVLELGPAERVDVQVTMNAPGVWILGATDDHDRAAGMGIVVEYAGKAGPPVWTTPNPAPWNYTAFGICRSRFATTATRIPLGLPPKICQLPLAGQMDHQRQTISTYRSHPSRRGRPLSPHL